MKQDKYQLAKQYEAQITRIREELTNIDKVTYMELRSPMHYGPEHIPAIQRDLNESPRIKAAIHTALEEELAEYEAKFNAL